MRVLTTIPGITIPRVRAELVACTTDLPDCAPHNESDWYLMRYLTGGDLTYVRGDDLGCVVLVDDEATNGIC